MSNTKQSLIVKHTKYSTQGKCMLIVFNIKNQNTGNLMWIKKAVMVMPKNGQLSGKFPPLWCLYSHPPPPLCNYPFFYGNSKLSSIMKIRDRKPWSKPLIYLEGNAPFPDDCRLLLHQSIYCLDDKFMLFFPLDIIND